MTDSFTRIFDTFPQPIVISTIKNNVEVVVYHNASFSTITGFSLDYVLGRSNNDFFLSYTKSNFFNSEFALSLDEKKDVGVILVLKSGLHVKTSIDITPFYIDGNKYHFISVNTRNEKNDEINASTFLQDIFNVLLHNLQYGILAENDSGDVILANQEYCNIFKIPYPSNMLIGEKATNVRAAGKDILYGSETLLLRFNEFIQKKRMIRELEVMTMDMRHLHVSYIPIMSSKIFHGSIWVFRDITKEKKEKEEFSALKANFNALKNTVDSLVWIIDTKFHLVSFNEKFVEHFMAFTNIKIMEGTDFTKIIKEDYSKLWKEKFERVLAGEMITFQRERSDESGTFTYEITLTPIFLSENKIIGIVCIKKDLTGYKNSLKSFEEMKRIAEESIHAKEQFLSHISHEMLTSVNAIYGVSNILLKLAPQPEQIKFLSMIDNSAENLRMIINDILDYTKIQNGKIELVKKDFILSEIIERAALTVKFLADDKGLPIITNISEKIPPIIVGDGSRLNQILINLLTNAVKFTDKGKIELNVELFDEKTEQVLLDFTIVDTGIGIPSEKIEKIFEKYERVKSSDGKERQGTGLGLAIVKGFVEILGGSILAESKIGVGSKFSVKLPYGRSDVNHFELLEKQRQLDEVEKFDLSSLNILVADDSSMNVMVLTHLLQFWGIHFEIAHDGQQTINILKNRSFDILLLDLNMPKLNGFEVTKLIRGNLVEKNRNIPILALTAQIDEGTIQRIEKAGMNDLLSKPFNGDQLKRKLLSLTGQQLITNIISHPDFNQTPNLEGKLINLSYLMEIAGGDDGFLIEMIENYLNLTPYFLNDLDLAIETENYKRVKNLVHKSKPSYRYIGIESANQMLIALEKNAIKGENLKSLPKLASDLRLCSEKVFIELKSFLDKYKKASNPPIK